MFTYIYLGTNDLGRAIKFYDAEMMSFSDGIKINRLSDLGVRDVPNLESTPSRGSANPVMG